MLYRYAFPSGCNFILLLVFLMTFTASLCIKRIVFFCIFFAKSFVNIFGHLTGLKLTSSFHGLGTEEHLSRSPVKPTYDLLTLSTIVGSRLIYSYNYKRLAKFKTFKSLQPPTSCHQPFYLYLHHHNSEKETTSQVVPSGNFPDDTIMKPPTEK